MCVFPYTSFGVLEFANRGPTTMGELASTKTPLRDLRILSNSKEVSPLGKNNKKKYVKNLNSPLNRSSSI